MDFSNFHGNIRNIQEAPYKWIPIWICGPFHGHFFQLGFKSRRLFSKYFLHVDGEADFRIHWNLVYWGTGLSYTEVRQISVLEFGILKHWNFVYVWFVHWNFVYWSTRLSYTYQEYSKTFFSIYEHIGMYTKFQ